MGKARRKEKGAEENGHRVVVSGKRKNEQYERRYK